MRLERLIVAGVLGLLVWLPVPLGSNRPWSAALFGLAVGVLLLLWGVVLLRDPNRRYWHSMQLAWPMIGLLAFTQLWVGLQWAFGLTTDVGETMAYWVLGMAYLGLFLLVLGLFKTRRRLSILLGVLVVNGVVHAFYGAMLVLTEVEWLRIGPDSGGVVSGTFVNRNHMAGYLEMTLACAIGLLLALRENRAFRWHHLAGLLIGPKAWMRLALVIMVIALVMTHSRMGNAAFFTSLLVVGGVFTLLTPTNRLRNALILVSVLAVDLLVISQWFGLEELQSRLVATQIEDQVIDGEVVRRENVSRDDVVVYALPQLRERPVAGFGAGSFETSFQRFPGRDITGLFDHAHNDYLQFAIEYGLVGVLPLAGFVIFGLWHGVRALMDTQSVYRSGVGTGALMGLVALLIHSFTDFNLQIPANAALFVVLAAVAVLSRSHRVAKR